MLFRLLYNTVKGVARESERCHRAHGGLMLLVLSYGRIVAGILHSSVDVGKLLVLQSLLCIWNGRHKD